ncbi:MAG: Ldh family oxidoreductase [Candidatus Latescibacterota bacterium]|nr:Ldh family oxidoreductase [Candidatus Latescibacterota bacterium]
MNRPPDSYVTVREDALLQFAIACFEVVGLPRAHAVLISRLLVNCDLRGVRSHGTRQVNGYCRAFAEGHFNPDPQPRVWRDFGAVVGIEGDGSLGYLPMVKATELAVERAQQYGLGMGTVRSIGHYGAAGNYCRMATAAGCIGFSVQGGQHGNATGANPKPQLGFFGNPPICFAIPGGEGPPVILDAATCILADYQRGPEFEALFSQIPAAFFKSVGYTAVAALLGGGLAGTTSDSAVSDRWPQATGGGTIIAIRIDAAADETEFCTEVDRMTRDVAATFEPLPGHDRALLPGAIEEELWHKQRLEGIRFGEMEQKSVREVGKRLGIVPPWEAGA